MGIETMIGAGASILGGAMGASGAKSAAKTQADATREANALQEKQFDQIRSDLAPYRNLGSGATNLLAQYLGINMPAGGGFDASSADRAAIRERLLPQFTTTTSASPGHYLGGDETAQVQPYGPGGTQSTINESALNAAIEREVEQMRAQAAATAPGTNAASPEFGSLLRNFTGQDLESEPGYQFGLKQGMSAVNNRLAAGGNFFSGAALKGATRFANDYASTKFGDAFNRDSANKTRIYNFLTGATSTGQNAAAQTGNAGSAMAGQVGANTTALGTAQGAARIAQGNAWANGLQGAASGYQQNELMNRVFGGNAGWGSSDGWRTSGNGMPPGY